MKKSFRIILWGFFILFTIFVILLLYGLCIPVEIPASKITIYDIHQNVLYESNSIHDLSIEDCPSFIKEAIVDVEDKRFYSHLGFDLLRIGKSLYTNIKNQDIVEGGSTITQQYAKNLFLNNRQTLNRKINELFLSLQIEMQYSKEEILEGYINSMYYGHGIYGFQNASKFYFGKEIQNLSTAEIALLIGIPNGPSYYSPIIDIEKAKTKRNQILSLLYKDGLLEKEEYLKAKQEEIILENKDYKVESEKNYYIDTVLNEVSTLSLEEDLSIYTYYDDKAQEALSSAIRNYNTIPSLESSGIIVEPYSGNIVAIQGGNDYTISSFNRALFAQRQIASTIKPLLYYCALEQGFTPSSTFLSTATTFILEDGSTYTPENYNKYYPNKDISMVHAISTSDNIYAVKTHLFLGMDTLTEALSAFAIKSEMNPSLALGSVNLSIKELSYIYNTFASEGYLIKPSCISLITSKNEIIYEREVKPKLLLNRDITLILNQMLTSTYDNNNIDGVYPTLYGNKTEVKTAVKSGTSLWDTWAIGFNPYYTVGIWNGYDDNSEMGKEEYAISKNIWQNCFNTIMKDKKEVWYEPSSNIESIKIDPISGKENSQGSDYWYLK